MPPEMDSAVTASSSTSPKRERIGNYLLGNEIGRGSFATVYKGYRSKTRTPVAIKAVARQKLTPKLLENLEGEISILKAISHPNVVELEDCIKHEHHIYLIMEFCSEGDLSVYIKKRGKLPETLSRNFLGQLTSALKFLRARDLIHRDIKPQNLLLHPPSPADLAAGHPSEVPILKLADFGFARMLPAGSLCRTLCGSPLYMAVEILRYESYDEKADLWSVGAVLYEMVTARPPFRAQNHVELLRKIEKGEDRIKFPDERSSKEGEDASASGLPVPSDLKNLIRRLLKRKPVERMGFEEFFACGVWEGFMKVPSIPATVQSVLEPSSSQELVDPVPANRNPTPIASPADTIRKASEPKYFVTAEASPVKPSPSMASPSSGLRPVYSRTQSGESGASGRVTPSAPEVKLDQPDQRTSVYRPSPGPSYQGDHIIGVVAPVSQGLGTSVQEADAAESTEYVLIEKRTVEVNELADEMDAASKRPTGLSRRRSSRAGVIGRPVSSITPGLPGTSNYHQSSPTSYSPPFSLSTTPPFAFSPSQLRSSPIPAQISASPSTNARSRPILVPQTSQPMTYHQAAQEARYSQSPGSAPSNSLARAISVAGLKWFGSPVNALGSFSRRSWRRHRLAAAAVGEIDPAEDALLESLEDIARKATALFDFADSKLALCVGQSKLSPSVGVFSTGGGTGLSPGSQAYFQQAGSRRRSSTGSASSVDLTIARLEIWCAESLVLYLKALAFLQHGVEMAKRYWEERAASAHVVTTSSDFNDIVQWFRNHFNDCFDKAEWARSKCAEEIPESASYVEKLIYDKAIDLSRTAAVNELVGEDLGLSETGYETALWLLYAVTDRILHEGQEVGEADKVMIEKVISSIISRLASLRSKMSAGQAKTQIQ